MLVLIFFIATFNLAVGYVLGSGVSPIELVSRLPFLRRRRAACDDDFDEDDLLTQPASPAAEKEEEAPPPPPAAPPAKPKRKANEVMSGLASLREKLTSASLELKMSQEDPTKFEDCATRLQEVNHDFVDQAKSSADELKELGASGDAAAESASKAVAAGAEEAARISDEYDRLLEGDLTDEKRAELVSQAAALKETSSKLQTEGEAALEEASATSAPEPEPTDDARSDTDALFAKIAAALEATEDEGAVLVASVAPDPLEGRDGDDAAFDALANQLDRLIPAVLDDAQEFASARGSDCRPMLLLTGDSVEDATRRLEAIRQAVESTTLEVGDGEINPTVSCALIDARKGDARQDLEARISQTLEESWNAGPNRIFHHDGAFPTEIAEDAAATA